MVDELQDHRRHLRTLSESSRSDASSQTASDSFGDTGSLDDESTTHQVLRTRPRKQNIRALRDEFEDDPELYGIRRSGRSRKEPFRFEEPRAEIARRRRKHLSSSEEDESGDSDVDDRWHRKTSHKSRGLRTRGNRVNYKSAFLDDSYDESENDGNARPLPSNNRGLHVNAQSSQQISFQKPKGPLVRKPHSAKLTDRPSTTRTRHEMKPELSEEEDDEEENSRSTTTYREPVWCDDEEADVIEEVLNHAIRRKGATGNPTTLYNTQLEKNLNENFNSSIEAGELQFLIKWRNWSHIHSTWETEATLQSPDRGCAVHGMKKLVMYQILLREKEERMSFAERDELETLAYEDERNEQVLSDKMKAERIVAHSRDPETNTFDYFVKWFRLDYRYCSWESGKVVRAMYKPAVEAYEIRCRSTKLPNLKCPVLHSRPKFTQMIEQSKYLGNSGECILRDYQLEGINWITRAWCRGNSAILADEMGLGKTIQTIGFLSRLFHDYSLFGPFLIVVPLSTVSSWQKELETWAPEMNAIMYIGDHVSRQLIREHEWSIGGVSGSRSQQSLKFSVCVTTYEILLKDKSWLSQVSWGFLGVDEAHRLKNDASQLYKALHTFKTNTRLLITGTPLQNTMKELWALLHFIMSDKFSSWEEFEESYSATTGDPTCGADSESFHNLHKVLRPFLLRRVKKDVESSLPEKIERVLRVDMTKEQSNIYRLILARNYDGLMKVTRGHRASFINIVMELKKCCNHSHLIASPSPTEIGQLTNEEYLSSLIRGSGKMTLLDKLLQRLRPKGHRVLIFSQMVRMLDLVADYLALRGWGFQRLDGSIRGSIRKQALDHFNAEGSTDFCFLLSTRAGGLGINLATADTVVIFDSDWNPQNDLQAQARAHRIGQKKQVSVYRLVTQDSVEEKIIESATRKMVLDHLVIQRMDSAGNKTASRKGESAKGHLLTEILRYGAEGLFKQTDEDTAELEVDIDDILNRAETRDTDAVNDVNPATALLSSFKVVALDAMEEETEQIASTDQEMTWDEIIPSEFRGQVKANEVQKTLVDLELGPRRRKQVKTFQAGLDPGDSSADTSEDESSIKQRSTCLTEKETRALVRAIKRFARPLERLDAIAAEAELPDKTENELREVVDAILKGCQMAMDTANALPTEDNQKPGKGPAFQFGRVSISAKPLLQSLEYLETLHQCLPSSGREARVAFELPFIPKLVAWSCPWDLSDDVRLLTGVYEYGYDNWDAIKLDVDLGLGSKLLPVSSSERPQSTHLRSRVDYLLKMLAKHLSKTMYKTPEHQLGKKRGIPDTNHSRSEYRPKHSDSSRKSKTSSKPTSGNNQAHLAKPKSAEFVETDDSSSDTDGADNKMSNAAAKKRSRVDSDSKSGKSERKTKPRKPPPPERSPQAQEQRVTTDHPQSKLSFTKEDEAGFKNMHGPLFLKCKEKLIPIKKHFKQLEYLEDSSGLDSKRYAKVVLRIGDHIHEAVRDIDDRDHRDTWKKYLWEFVQLFSKKSTDDLRHIYRQAIKKKEKQADEKKESMHLKHSPRTERSSKDTDHKHHDHSGDRQRSYKREPLHNHTYNSTEHAGYRDRYNRDRDARFDNAFNRPPSSMGPAHGNSNHRDRSFTQSRYHATRDSHSSHEPHPSSAHPPFITAPQPADASRDESHIRAFSNPTPEQFPSPRHPVDSFQSSLSSFSTSSRDPRLSSSSTRR